MSTSGLVTGLLVGAATSSSRCANWRALAAVKASAVPASTRLSTYERAQR
ncbi:hypothetical protein GS438_11750 [Rhodococcus hoagii]|nr:hypothetical protein [Prescottella equi]